MKVLHKIRKHPNSLNDASLELHSLVEKFIQSLGKSGGDVIYD